MPCPRCNDEEYYFGIMNGHNCPNANCSLPGNKRKAIKNRIRKISRLSSKSILRSFVWDISHNNVTNLCFVLTDRFSDIFGKRYDETCNINITNNCCFHNNFQKIVDVFDAIDLTEEYILTKAKISGYKYVYVFDTGKNKYYKSDNFITKITIKD